MSWEMEKSRQTFWRRQSGSSLRRQGRIKVDSRWTLLSVLDHPTCLTVSVV